jgi:uncharacterized membrane protein YkoI
MKQRIVVSVVLAGLMVASAVLLVGSHRVFAAGTAAVPSQVTVAATAADTETADSNVQEPSYTGSIKVADTASANEAGESAALQGSAKIAQADAEKAALAKVPGTLVRTTFENENGYLVYSVTIKNAQGALSDVKVDAGTGSVLTIEASDGTEKAGTEAGGEKASTAPDTDTVQEEVQSGN